MLLSLRHNLSDYGLQKDRRLSLKHHRMVPKQNVRIGMQMGIQFFGSSDKKKKEKNPVWNLVWVSTVNQSRIQNLVLDLGVN